MQGCWILFEHSDGACPQGGTLCKVEGRRRSSQRSVRLPTVNSAGPNRSEQYENLGRQKSFVTKPTPTDAMIAATEEHGASQRQLYTSDGWADMSHTDAVNCVERVLLRP